MATPDMEDRVHITPEGATRLRQELNHIWRVQRPDVTRNVAAAAALGDRSENADYIYGKRQLREIDKRIRYLTKTLDRLEVVDRKPDDRSRIFFGAWVTLADEDDRQVVLRIVGADEFDPKRHWISIHSPVAKRLLGKRVGDEIVMDGPEGPSPRFIEAVTYDPPGESV